MTLRLGVVKTVENNLLYLYQHGKLKNTTLFVHTVTTNQPDQMT